MKNSRVGINVATSLLQQAATVVCGFIVPRLVLGAYGSAYNGIVGSVSNFLSGITLLSTGVGGVTRAALYRSLEANDADKLYGKYSKDMQNIINKGIENNIKKRNKEIYVNNTSMYFSISADTLYFSCNNLQCSMIFFHNFL